jgi:site-specific recombinase XerD
MIANRPVAPNKGKKYPPEPLTPREVDSLIGRCSLSAPTGIRNRALLTLLYRSGLRVSEVLALRPADINFADHSARVLHGKGNKATVRMLHPSADDAVARWIDTRAGLAAEHGWAAVSGRPLFCTLDGGPVSDDYVRVLLRRLARKAGIEKRVHPHGLRHTFADELRAAGADIVVVSKLLGHSSISVTARYLDHLSNKQAIDAGVLLDLPPLS